MHNNCNFEPTENEHEYRCTRCGFTLYADVLPIYAECTTPPTKKELAALEKHRKAYFAEKQRTGKSGCSSCGKNAELRKRKLEESRAKRNAK